MKKSDADAPILPPIDFSPPSNGEFCPAPPTARAAQRHQLWRQLVEDQHRRLGLTRRAFAESACGTAAWLWTLSALPACTGKGGATSDAGVNPADVAGFDVPREALSDQAHAGALLAPDPFVFDVQTHIWFDEIRPWPEKNPPQRVLDFLKRIFVQSNTTVACVSGVPETRAIGLPNVEARAVLQELIDRIGGPRLRFHCNANPEAPGEPDYMAEAAMKWKQIAGWKTYPQAPDHGLDHPDCEPFLERARALGIKVIAAHRGIAGNSGYRAPGSPLDVVRAAKKFPDLKFIVYHAGWESTAEENHPYADAGDATKGVDRLIKALRENQIGPDGNVYAELGTTWFNLIGDAMAAGHVLGKLLAQIGPDRVVWGTDTVFNGLAQPQIDAFWMYQLPAALAGTYPAITPEAKRKVLGLSGAAVYGVDPTAMRYAIGNDDIEKLRMAYRDDPRALPMPHPREYLGPRNRREFLAFRRFEATGKRG